MDREQEPKKKTAQQLYIDEAAKAGAKEVLLLQRKQADINHYRAMENLLRAYPKRVRMMNHPEEYPFFPVGRSKDISIAPPPGSGVLDKIEVAEMFTEARKRAYEHEVFRLMETEYAVAPFKQQPEFIIIRMYYFNENAQGVFRGNDAKPYSFEEISEELKAIGIDRSVRTLRMWRTKLVREMTVMMFGVDGALSIESREQKHKEDGDTNAQA